MIIVKRKSEIVRFGFFVALVALMAYYISGKADLWRTSETPSPTTPVNMELTAAEATPASDGRDFFATFRLDRDRERGAFQETLKEVMDSPTADADVRKQATQEYVQLSKEASLETKAERMVKAKGFDDAVVHLTEGSAQVIVKAASVSEQQFRQIMDAVSRATGVKPASIQVNWKER